MACLSILFSVKRRLMDVTITTPFSTATPNSAMKPIELGTDKYCPDSQSVIMPPIKARGMLIMIRAAWPNEPKAKYSNRKISARDVGTTIMSRA